MAEYIDREALLAEMRVSSKAAYLVVMDAPAADVAPVVRGRWVPCENGGYYCSKCDSRVAFLVHNHYCPNCGARMEESESK